MVYVRDVFDFVEAEVEGRQLHEVVKSPNMRDQIVVKIEVL